MTKKAASLTKSGSIVVRQYRSAAGYDKRTLKVLAAIGLGRIGKEKTLASSPALLGQVARVAHLVKVTNS